MTTTIPAWKRAQELAIAAERAKDDLRRARSAVNQAIEAEMDALKALIMPVEKAIKARTDAAAAKADSTWKVIEEIAPGSAEQLARIAEGAAIRAAETLRDARIAKKQASEAMAEAENLLSTVTVSFPAS